MKMKKVKQTYTRENIPPQIKKDFDDASRHLSACWMLMSAVMQHLDSAEDAVRRWGVYRFEVKQNFQAINNNFNKLNDWFRKMACETSEGLELFNKEYGGCTSAINKILGFNEYGEYEEEE